LGLADLSSDAKALGEVVREEMEVAMTLKAPVRAEAGLGTDWMSAKNCAVATADTTT